MVYYSMFCRSVCLVLCIMCASRNDFCSQEVQCRTSMEDSGGNGLDVIIVKIPVCDQKIKFTSAKNPSYSLVNGFGKLSI
jgi:hypothetical protein